MKLLFYLHVLICLGSCGLSRATNWCPGQTPASGSSCNSTTLSASLPLGVTIEVINEVSQGGCYGEDTDHNIFYGQIDTATCQNAVYSSPCNYAIDLPPSCALIVNMGTYRFGLIMPTVDNWKGSLLAVGSYSFGGGINWKDMWTGPKYYGMATMSTDTGHSSIQGDMSWAKNNRQAQEDWGYVAMDGSTKMAKKILSSYYGTAKPLQHSYYSGCSTGGRQGLKQLQVDQSQYDGLLIGAPAWDQIHEMPWLTKLAALNPPNKSSSIMQTQDQINAIISGIRQGCDSLDNVTDQIISRPDLCDITKHVRPILLCSGNPTPSCLTDSQLQTLAQVHQDFAIQDGATTRTVFPGPELGSESDLSVWLTPAIAQPPAGFDWQWELEFLAEYQSNYTYSDQIVIDAEQNNPGNATVRPEQTDWSTFRQRGGKLLLYHGLADGVIPAGSTLNYVNAVNKTVGGQTDDFMAYFQVPGMHHCFTSDTINNQYNAPWMFGGAGQHSSASIDQTSSVLLNSTTDALSALINWVEGKGSPQKIVATTWVAGSSTTVFRQRPICPYPQRAINTTASNLDSALSWECL